MSKREKAWRILKLIGYGIALQITFIILGITLIILLPLLMALDEKNPEFIDNLLLTAKRLEEDFIREVERLCGK